MTFIGRTVNPTLCTAVGRNDVAAVQRFVTPTATRSRHRIDEDLQGENAQGDTVWTIAARVGSLDVMTVLAPLVRRRHSNRRGENALHLAAGQGHTEVVDALLEQWGLSAFSVDQDRATALMRAARHGALDTVERLLPSSPLLATTIDGTNALGLALQQTHWEVADRLAQAMPGDEVHRTLAMMRPLWPPQRALEVPFLLPGWSVQQERRALRQALATTLDDPAANGGPGQSPSVGPVQPPEPGSPPTAGRPRPRL